MAKAKDDRHWNAVDKIWEPRIEFHSLCEGTIERISLVIAHVVSAVEVDHTIRTYPNRVGKERQPVEVVEEAAPC